MDSWLPIHGHILQKTEKKKMWAASCLLVSSKCPSSTTPGQQQVAGASTTMYSPTHRCSFLSTVMLAHTLSCPAKASSYLCGAQVLQGLMVSVEGKLLSRRTRMVSIGTQAHPQWPQPTLRAQIWFHKLIWRRWESKYLLYHIFSPFYEKGRWAWWTHWHALLTLQSQHWLCNVILWAPFTKRKNLLCLHCKASAGYTT